MKAFVPFVACVLLAAGVVFVGLSNRYQVSQVKNEVVKLDRLTGRTWLLDTSIPVWVEINKL